MATQYLSAPPTFPVFDARGGSYHTPDNWVQVAPGKWALSGSGEATTYDPSAPVITPDQLLASGGGNARALNPGTVYTDAGMASQFMGLHPDANNPFLPGLVGGHHVNNPDFNPVIAALAGYGAPVYPSAPPPLTDALAGFGHVGPSAFRPLGWGETTGAAIPQVGTMTDTPRALTGFGDIRRRKLSAGMQGAFGAFQPFLSAGPQV